jgi:hypothetical protein
MTRAGAKAGADFTEALKGTGFEYVGRSDSLGITEFQHPGNGISVSVRDKDLTPEKIRAKIDAKKKAFNADPIDLGKS